MHPGIKISESEVTLRLVKTIPGLEGDVYSQLREAYPRDNSQVLLSFGDYDLLTVARGGHTHTGAIPNILGAREVVCFGIEQIDGSEQADLVKALEERGVFSLTFVRLPGFFTNRNDTQPERRFLEWWWSAAAKSDARRDQFLLGTLGGPEFVVVYAGDDLESVHSWIQNGPMLHDSVAKSFSIIAVSGEFLTSDTVQADLGRCCRGLSMELTISCRPEHSLVLGDYVESLVTDLNAALRSGSGVDGPSGEEPGDYLQVDKRALVTGMEDLVLSMTVKKPFELRQLIGLVVDFRRECRAILLGTSVAFQHVIEREQADENPKRRVAEAAKAFESVFVGPPRLDISISESEKIDGIEDVGRVALRALYQFGNIMQNPLLANDLIDLFNYFQSFKRQALAMSPQDVKARSDLADRLTPAHHGVDQRTIGANEGVNPVESNVRHFLGGTQKIMQAAEAVPLSVFKQFNDSLWPGFIIFGTFQDFMNHDYLAVNLPLSCMWDPSRWVWLLHESIHGLLCNDQKMFSPQQGGFADVKNRIRKSQFCPRGMTANMLEDLGLEVFTDLIEIHFGPSWRRGLVLSTRWGYYKSRFDLKKLSESQATSLAVRTLFAWIALKERPLFRGAVSKSLPDFDSYVRSWREEIERWPDELRGSIERVVTEGRFEDLGRIIELLWPLHEFAVSVAPFGCSELAERESWWNGDGEERTQNILEGRPISGDEVRFPELFIWKLVDSLDNGNGLSIPQRTAAILSLHDWYREHWIAHRNRALKVISSGD